MIDCIWLAEGREVEVWVGREGTGMDPKCLDWEKVEVMPNPPHRLPSPSATANDGAIC